MSRLHATVLALVLCGVPHAATAAPSDFDRVVHAVESQIEVSRLPMFGLGFLFRASTWLTEPAGASGMEMAVFNPTSADGGHDSHGFSIATFEDVVTRTLDKSWHLTLRTISNGDQSHSLIWVRPGEKHFEVMLGIAQPNNGVLMRFKLSETKFRQWIEREEGGTAAK